MSRRSTFRKEESRFMKGLKLVVNYIAAGIVLASFLGFMLFGLWVFQQFVWFIWVAFGGSC